MSLNSMTYFEKSREIHVNLIYNYIYNIYNVSRSKFSLVNETDSIFIKNKKLREEEFKVLNKENTKTSNSNQEIKVRTVKYEVIIDLYGEDESIEDMKNNIINSMDKAGYGVTDVNFVKVVDEYSLTI